MNVFFLREDPKQCAREHCDKHVVKMNCEYAQILSTAHRVLDGEMWYGQAANGRKIIRYFLNNAVYNSELYLAAHINHPSVKWARYSKENYEWLYKMWIALGEEYTYRYGKKHESLTKLEYLLLTPPNNFKKTGFTQPPPAMSQYPDCIVEGDSIASYRNYYWAAKRDFCVWTRRDKPDWWQNYERKGIETETYVSISERV